MWIGGRDYDDVKVLLKCGYPKRFVLPVSVALETVHVVKVLCGRVVQGVRS